MSVCPKGHTSTSTDYCDECGTPMSTPAPETAADMALSALSTWSNACPECSIERGAGARFCEVCQYDFQLALSGSSNSRLARSVPSPVPATSSRVLPRPGLPSMAPTFAVDARLTRLSPPMLVRIHADLSLAPDPESRLSFPSEGIVDRIFHLDLDENMVGRDSASKNAHPEIPLRDPGASRRHLKIARIQGIFHALELGSSNGTLLDGVPLEPGVAVELRAGSTLRVGMWTTMLIELR